MSLQLADAHRDVANEPKSIDPAGQKALDLLAEAQKRAYEAVVHRQERWVAFDLQSGDLLIGDDDYQHLLAGLIEKYGPAYYTQVSIIGPNT